MTFHIFSNLKSCFSIFWLMVIILLFSISAITKFSSLPNLPLDWDQIYTVKTTRSSFIDIATGKRYDPGSPPLHYLILKVWISFVGNEDVKIRILPFFFYVGSFISLFKLMENRFCMMSRAVVMSFFSFSSILFYFSSYIRSYSMYLFLAILMYKYIFNYVFERKQALITVLISLVGFYTHYSIIIFYIFVMFSFWIIGRNRGLVIERFCLLSFFLLIGYMPWIITFFKAQIYPQIPWHSYDFHQINEGWKGLGGWLDVFTNGIFSSLNLKIKRVIAVLMLISYNVLMINNFKKTRDLFRRSVLLFSLLSLNVLLLTPLHNVFNDYRYSLYIFPFFYLSIAVILEKKLLMNLIAVIIVTFVGLRTYNFSHYELWQNWKAVSSLIPNYCPGGIILLKPCYLGFSLDYYYQGKIPMYCLDENESGVYFSIWDRSNYQKLFLITRRDELQNLSSIDKLKEQYSSSSRVQGNVEVRTLTLKKLLPESDLIEEKQTNVPIFGNGYFPR